MPPTLGRNEYDEIIKLLKDEENQDKSEHLQKLFIIAKQRPFDFTSDDLLEIFTQLKAIMQTENPAMTVQCLNVIHELIASYSKDAIEGFGLILEILVRYLSEVTVAILILTQTM